MKRRNRNERLTEDEWKIRHLVTSRFPGFSGEVFDRYWDMVENRKKDYSKSKIARELYEDFEVDVQDLEANSDSSTQIKRAKSVEEVESWLECVIQFYSEIPGSGIKLDIFFRNYLSHNSPADFRYEFPKIEAKLHTSATSEDYDNWLRYNSWTLEEAAEFASKGRDKDEFSQYLEKIEAKFGSQSKDIPPRISPCDFIVFAKDQGWDDAVPKPGSDSAEVECLEQVHPSRIAAIDNIILGIAISKFGFDPKDQRSPAPMKIQSALERKGHMVGQETVRRILRSAYTRWTGRSAS